MPPAEDPTLDPSPPSAEDAYREFLRRREAGEPLDLESFAAERPALRHALRVLHSLHAAVPASSPASEAAPPGFSLPSAAPVPERVGPYRILGVLGEGGMGVVYLAEATEPLRRRVALKLIKLGMDTREVVARFETERQALALMSHPGIARVFEAGSTPEGRPYFVMELIAGEPITRYSARTPGAGPVPFEVFLEGRRASEAAEPPEGSRVGSSAGSFHIAVTDGRLDVELAPPGAESLVSSIEIEPCRE